MEYQKNDKFVKNTANQLSKFRTKNKIEINANPTGTYNTTSHIVFKTTIIKSSLCDYREAFILMKGTITVGWTRCTHRRNSNKKKQ